MGHDRHIMSYAIAGGQQYNMVITHPTEAVEEVGSSTKPMSEILDQMRSYYADWDPRYVLQAWPWLPISGAQPYGRC